VDGLDGLGRRLRDGERDANLSPERILRRGAEQPEEVALDPLAREVVRDDDDERAVVQGASRRGREPGFERRFVECVP
jgi:hypothetical protein